METIYSARYAEEIASLSQELLDRFEENRFSDDCGIVPIGTKEELIIICRKLQNNEFQYRIEPTEYPEVFILNITSNIDSRTLWINEYWKRMIEGEFTEDAPNIISPNNIPQIPNESTIRFSGADWYQKMQEQSITVAGLGGIGSWVSLLIARLNPSHLNLYDGDLVDATNMSGQLYTNSDVGRSKNLATVSNIVAYSNFQKFVTYGYFHAGSAMVPIMICGFDNMKARKTFYNRWKQSLPFGKDLREKYLFIDGRLAIESYQVFAITGNDERTMKIYEEKWLFDDSEAEETVCSLKQTSHMASMIASTMVNVLVNHVTNQVPNVIPRDVPFMIEYDAPTMYTKVLM